MSRILQSFAAIYRKSAPGRRGPVKDYTIDYEKFLRLAGVDDGDEREIAEREIAVAASESGGLFRIDRQLRTGAAIRLRLSKIGGEEWLFQQTGEVSPDEKRRELADYFAEVSHRPVPNRWQPSWATWFSKLADLALHGESVHPFSRHDPDANRILANALAGVLNWQGPSLVRYASAAICGDSKQLQALESRLRIALAEVTDSSSFEDFGIFRKPRSVTFHGPIAITLGSSIMDFSIFPAPVTLSEDNLTKTVAITTKAPLCLTVENEDVFHELASNNPGVLLIQTSFPGSAALRLIERLPVGLPFHHFGDSDPAGSDILRDLREKTGKTIQPLLMHRSKTPAPRCQQLSDYDLQTLKRLLNSDLLNDLHPHLEDILESGEKGLFEQENISVAEVWAALASFTSPRPSEIRI